MGYFSNGTEGELFRDAWCEHCVNWRDLEDGRGPGCPVMDVHLMFAYEECNSTSNAKSILDTLIVDKEIVASDGLALPGNECAMFLADGPQRERLFQSEDPELGWAEL